jgi:ADP-ribosyltransferase exoenzyme
VTGRASLDLAYDPHQLRGDDGRWVKDPTAAQRSAIDARELTREERDRGNASLDGFRPVRPPGDADAARYLRGTAPHLTAAQRDAVTRYTGDEFYKLNRALRAGDDSDPEVRRLDAAMRPVPGDMILARHVDMSPDQARALAGKRISDKAYSSAVLGSPHAGGLGGLTLHIAVPKGTPVINAAALSSNPHEREVILGRGTVLAVSRVVPNSRYGYDAYAVVIPPSGPSAVSLAAPSQPPPQQVPPGQQPPPQSDAVQDAAMVLLISELLLTAATAALLIAAVRVRFAMTSALLSGLHGSATIAMEHPPPVTGVIGPASAQTSRQNLARRAQFVLSAGKRLAGDIAAWRAKHTGPSSAPPSPPGPLPGPATAQAADLNVLRRGQFADARHRRLQADIDAAEDAGRMQALQAGLARERRYYSLHLAAMWQRATAAGKTDMAAMEHGNLLGWYTVIDQKTSAECFAADHHNYYADRMPDIGWPGGGPHPNCRCFPGPAWPGAPLLPSRRTVGLAS